MLESFSPALPAVALYPATAVLLVLHAIILWRLQNSAARFVVAALWLRYAMSAYHQITYEPVLAGLSLNALASCAVVALGVWVAHPRDWRLKALVPVYAVMGGLAVSGAINREVAGSLDALVKWGYFAVVLVCAYQAIRQIGQSAFSVALLFAFAPPVVLQWLSVALGVSKLGDESGTRSFIGGYHHEAAFSIILVTGLWVVAMQRRARSLVLYAVSGVLLVGLVLAAYRTTMIAAAPMAVMYVGDQAALAFRRRDRAAVGAIAVLLAVIATAGVAYVMRDRFADFFALVGEQQLMRPPDAYTQEQRELFSSRIYLWRQYLDAYADGTSVRHLFGFGPGAWEGNFITYAHNTLISALYETGAFGLIMVLALWGSMTAAALRAPDAGTKALLLAGHASFILLNMATMAQWLVEGLIFYALVCAATLANAHVRVRSPTKAPTRAARGASVLPARPR